MICCTIKIEISIFKLPRFSLVFSWRKRIEGISMIRMKGEAIARNVLMREVEGGYKREGTNVYLRPIHVDV